MARDWLRTLWNASYKGVPFFVEMDNESGSRRIVEHEFPMRDDPFLEDLGEGVRHYNVTAYVVGDGADGNASAVMQICATRGPGILVLPTHGPILVRCLTFERDRKKDKHGYIAHGLKFSREGATGALASISQLANLIFVAADTMAIALASSFLTSIDFLSQADYVRTALVGGIEDNVSMMESIRTSSPIDPVVSAEQRFTIQSLFLDAETAIDPPPAIGAGDFETAIGRELNSPPVDLVARFVAVARALGDGLEPLDAISTFEDLFVASQIEIPGPIFVTAGTSLEADLQRANMRALRIAALTTYSEAISRLSLTDRQSAATLRANVAEHFEYELLSLSASEIALARAIAGMRDAVVDYLSRAILNLAPVIPVASNISMPSLWWAHRLYADPYRATELVARNRLAHPSFFPLEFEALAK
jgi:prophage DNA circulation protein